MKISCKRLYKQEEGQGLVEYSLVLLLIALVVFSVIGKLGQVLLPIFENTAHLLMS